MVGDMAYVLVLVIVGAGLSGLGLGWYLTRQAALGSLVGRRAELAAVLDQTVEVMRQERGESMQAALSTVLSVASSKLGDQMEAGRGFMADLIEHDRLAVTTQVQGVQVELSRMATLVNELRQESARQSGQVNTGLEQAVRATSSLAATTQSLQRALASPKARGQWGERMAEDVLRSAGFMAGINYTKQTRLATGRVPDYTFPLPHGHVVHMDVKFPIDNYLRWLDADSDQVRAGHVRQFQRDVRQRIKELAGRDYVDPETTVDYLLLFVPNESVYGFLHEHDETLIDEAIAQKVILCSPTTLFAVLAVIRQAVDNFLVERRSDEILAALAGLREQWDRWSEPIEKMRRGLQSAQRAFDDLAGPRYRQFARQLEKLEAVRDNRDPELDDVGDVPPAVAGNSVPEQAAIGFDDPGFGWADPADPADLAGPADLGDGPAGGPRALPPAAPRSTGRLAALRQVV
jgi:DNA recombination protein RmuC